MEATRLMEATQMPTRARVKRPLLLLEYFFQSAPVSVHSNKIYRRQCYISFHKSQVIFGRAMLNT